MNVYLMRHCTPAAGERLNADRPLTPGGREEAQDMADFMVRQIGRVDIVISSDYIRAKETADIMAKALGSYVATTKQLEPDCKPKDAWDEVKRLAQASSDVLVVSHHPLIGHMIDYLADNSGIGHEFGHGSIACIVPDPPAMHWMVDREIATRQAQFEAAEACALADVIEMGAAGLELAEALTLEEGWVTIDGAHVFIGDDGIITKGPARLLGLSHKSAIAKSNYSGGSKHEQDIAEKMENHLAKELGMKKSSNNKPFDLFGTKYAVEVKTLVSNTNDKITMNKAAVGRKDAFIKQSGLKPFTVVVDARGKTPQYFVRAKYGSFRIGAMTPAASPAAVRSFMRSSQ